MSTHLSNIFLVTKPIVHNMPMQVKSHAHIAKALESVETVEWIMPDDKEELQEEKNYWVKQWKVVLVRQIMVASNADTDDRPEGTRRCAPRGCGAQG